MGHLPELQTFWRKKLGQWAYLKFTISTKSLTSIPLINDDAVYRTAPATLGLFITYLDGMCFLDMIKLYILFGSSHTIFCWPILWILHVFWMELRFLMVFVIFCTKKTLSSLGSLVLRCYRLKNKYSLQPV